MRGPLLLAWRHLTHHLGRTVLIAAAVALAGFLPLAVERLVDVYGSQLRERAAATPLLIGKKGSRYDLALSALYFKGRIPEPLTAVRAEAVNDSGLALAIPLALGRSAAQGHPLVGTSLDYFEFRKLAVARGSLPITLGDAVVGARLARSLGLDVGSTVLSDRGNVYDLSLAYPLKMHVVGILAESGTPDDDAIFCDVKTAWIVDGIGHGHKKTEASQPDEVLEQSDQNVTFNASLTEYVEITAENLDSFHFHGDTSEFPISAVLALPNDAKSSTLLKGRYRLEGDLQILVPREAIEEILGFVFQLKRFFDANVMMVGMATALFLALIVALSLRVRQRELETLRKIGCGRGVITMMLGWELAITIGCGVATALILSTFAVEWFARSILTI